MRDDVNVPLTPKSFATLLTLVENNGRIVEKEQLMKKVWPDTCVEEANLAQHIFILRKLLDGGDEGNRYIETIPKRGYRFIASVKEIHDKDAAARSLMPGGANVLAGQNPRIGERARSIAVLPFRIIGPQAEDEYLGVGLADALITRLSNLRQLAVRPTSAVCKYLGGAQDPARVGQELDVDSVIEGTIQKLGRRLRVTVQLVSVPEGLSLWAEKFDERFTDIFTLEDSISEQVMSALLLKLTDEERLHFARQQTHNHEAYKQYLKGRFFWNKSRVFRNKHALEDLQQSTEHFKQAIGIDPHYALAYAGLSDSYISLSTAEVMPANDCLWLAKEAALKALEIDDTIAEAHCSLATVRELYDWDWHGAELEYKRAIQLNPGYLTAHHWYAKYLAKVGRHTEAIDAIAHALELDPLSFVIIIERARLHYFARQYEQAIEQSLDALDMDPSLNSAHAILALAYAGTGNYKEAIKHAKKMLQASGNNSEPMAFVAYVYGKSGQIKKALEVFEDWKRSAGSKFISPFYRAVICIGTGEQEQALSWLERAYEERACLLTYLSIPIFDSLRTEPKFADILKGLKLSA